MMVKREGSHRRCCCSQSVVQSTLVPAEETMRIRFFSSVEREWMDVVCLFPVSCVFVRYGFEKDRKDVGEMMLAFLRSFMLSSTYNVLSKMIQEEPKANS